MNPIEEFYRERTRDIADMVNDENLQKLTISWLQAAGKYKYGYNFRWLDRPIIQLPGDILALQELIWTVKPDLIIETGIAHGGSIIYSASMLELLGGDGTVVGIDIDIRRHNRYEIEKHPMFKRITMLEGSSTDESLVTQVENFTKGKKSIMVFLDSNHTHEHVLKELQIYSRYVSVNSYIVVFDTMIEFFPDETNNDRPWGVGNNPWTAAQEFLKYNKNFVIDKSIDNKVLLTTNIDGYLKRVK